MINTKLYNALRSPETAKRFWEKVDKNGPVHPVLGTECWIWTAFKDWDGYGKFTIYHGRTIAASRYVYLSNNLDTDGEGLVVCHHCDNPACCNPEHLFTGTNLDNIKDRNSKNRQSRGIKVCTNILSEEEVIEIIKWKPDDTIKSMQQLADKYGVARVTVKHIRNGRLWKHIHKQLNTISI